MKKTKILMRTHKIMIPILFLLAYAQRKIIGATINYAFSSAHTHINMYVRCIYIKVNRIYIYVHKTSQPCIYGETFANFIAVCLAKKMCASRRRARYLLVVASAAPPLRHQIHIRNTISRICRYILI